MLWFPPALLVTCQPRSCPCWSEKVRRFCSISAAGSRRDGEARHSVQREGWHGAPRGGLVELINCFCSTLGVSFNIHQPVMKESSELSSNIDGPGRLTAGLGTLPPARALPRPHARLLAGEDPLGFPMKTPRSLARWASPREAAGKGGLLPAASTQGHQEEC